MKKSLLNIAITTTMATALLSGPVLATQAYASESALLQTSQNHTSLANNVNHNDTTEQNYMLPAMGIGAAAGTAVAGPVGFLIGGLVGAVVGSKQEASPASEETSMPNMLTLENNSMDDSSTVTDMAIASPNRKIIQLAQIGPVNTVVEDDMASQQEELINILTTDISLDVYFRSGSIDLEVFYSPRLAAIAKLMNTMDKLGKDKLELHLDGYTDRRGGKTQNIALANDRIANVREQLVLAGVADERIISKAFGEKQMVSTAGDLEGYNFDRKVVIRFERSNPDSHHSVAEVLSDSETEESIISDNEASQSPVFADVSTQF